MVNGVEIVPKIYDTLVLNCTARERVIVGGRGRGASWSIARILLCEGLEREHLVACVRELQSSIANSVKLLLEKQIAMLDFGRFYSSTRTEIRGINGTRFIFSGLRDHDADKIKSMEGATRCWVAEAQSISRRSVDILRPTIRAPGSIIWWDLNPRYATDPVYADYVAPETPPHGSAVCWVSMDDNHWAPHGLASQREADYARDPERASHIWEGKLEDSQESHVFNLNLVSAAMARDKPAPGAGNVTVGVDVAHRGGDEIVFYAVNPGGVIDQRFATNQSAVQTREALEQFCTDTGASRVIIDNGHIGAAVADELQHNRADIIVQREDFGSKPKGSQGSQGKLYANRVTEMYFEARDVLETVSIPNDNMLRDQLICRRWSFVSSNEGERKRLEKKDEIQRTPGWSSPDRADALVLALTGLAQSNTWVGGGLGLKIF